MNEVGRTPSKLLVLYIIIYYSLMNFLKNQYQRLFHFN